MHEVHGPEGRQPTTADVILIERFYPIGRPSMDFPTVLCRILLLRGYASRGGERQAIAAHHGLSAGAVHRLVTGPEVRVPGRPDARLRRVAVAPRVCYIWLRKEGTC